MFWGSKMARIQFKQKCFRCKKKYVLTTSRKGFPVCYDCEKAELHGKVKDPKMKRLFSIPEEYYKEIPFLRDIKIKYLRFGELSEKQIEKIKKMIKEKKEELS